MKDTDDIEVFISWAEESVKSNDIKRCIILHKNQGQICQLQRYSCKYWFYEVNTFERVVQWFVGCFPSALNISEPRSMLSWHSWLLVCAFACGFSYGFTSVEEKVMILTVLISFR